jgi:S1-C subfamily serine protease
MADTQNEASPFFRRLRDRIRDLFIRYKPFIPLILVGVISFAGIMINRLTITDQVILSAKDVEEIAAITMATATPPPAVSAQIYQTILPSVVIVQTSRDVESEPSRLLGGGVIISEDALILTSLHVVADATEIRVTFADGTSTLAIIIDQQTNMDIAVLLPDQLPSIVVPATIGRASSVQIGDDAFVVGNPLGLMGSMTAGIISGLDRTFTIRGTDQPIEGLIQFDAAISPGNSGGPLLNRDGQLIGIVTGLLSPMDQEAFIGIGFAVPIDVAASAAGSPPY